MPSPFPGVDPFIESGGHWRDFRKRLLGMIGVCLAESLPESYEALYEEEVHTVTWSAGEEVRDLWIEIIGLPGQELVTVIELLSPTNKASSGREEYLAKRRAVLGQPVHLVELDLLRGGARVPMREPLPPGDFFAFVARHERRPDCEVYTWSLRDRLPVIPLPLKAPDPDLPLDLAAFFDRAYDQGRYARLLRYDAPLAGPLRPEDRAWAEAVVREQG